MTTIMLFEVMIKRIRPIQRVIFEKNDKLCSRMFENRFDPSDSTLNYESLYCRETKCS